MSSTQPTLPVQKAPMHVPPLEEVLNVLQDGLEKNFSSISVSVVDCPDLTKEPFFLSSPGICGKARLADIGGPPFLLPLPQKDKKFNFKQISKLVDLPDAFMIGAGAGPHHVVGVNCELVCNVHVPKDKDNDLTNQSYTVKVGQKDQGCVMEKMTCTDFCLMGNFLCSEGKPGKVLEVIASQRTGPLNFMSCLQKTLANYYKEKPVALGGTFLVEKGKARLHIMPDFSDVPLNCDDDVNNWLKFYEMDAPLVCVGELVSYDPGLQLRMEHFHCFSQHGQGGHYHYDTTPNEVKYRGYFSLAETIYRIDEPKEGITFGRDDHDIK
ncbi:ester hydrolase C11orf54 homolog [Gigantopelta aegis]|uniref:ester hydrolase C11orf54 homolog n=1 Tax=Gigantopelta aegis TaxID=1735272 RepID=UPI001B887E70|nr:ester hydrolase C11orf54 homolog [Gigantopelta aegis]